MKHRGVAVSYCSFLSLFPVGELASSGIVDQCLKRFGVSILISSSLLRTFDAMVRIGVIAEAEKTNPRDPNTQIPLGCLLHAIALNYGMRMTR